MYFLLKYPFRTFYSIYETELSLLFWVIRKIKTFDMLFCRLLFVFCDNVINVIFCHSIIYAWANSRHEGKDLCKIYLKFFFILATWIRVLWSIAHRCVNCITEIFSLRFEMYGVRIFGILNFIINVINEYVLMKNKFL